MPATAASRRRTRAFARVVGPFLAIIAGLVAVRASEMDVLLAAFFANAALAWVTGAIVLLFGIFIIANHQVWSSAAAVVISLLGWVLLLRGLALLVAPQVIAEVGASAVEATPWVRLGAGIMAAVGLWLSYVGWIAGTRRMRI
ncbi:hypothetical protein [Bradyrhizobium sp. 2TAF24]|uniref:hypothetical protein n=1 Tax=Bradyrhizobium sp. 2TAF24 TaxID=3233011 RepID=UPI003F934F8A